MNLYEKLISKKEKISLIGLGYVGLPIAIAFAKKVDVIGFDVSKHKIELYEQGIDRPKRLEILRSETVVFTLLMMRAI